MQENKDNRNRQKWSEWFAKELDLMEKLKKPEDKALRWKGLLRAAVVGVPFLFVADFFGLSGLIGGAGDGVGRASINLFFVSLPTLTLLWWFRTYDARQQIQKTDEAINANLFGMYLKMLLSKEIEERCHGLLGLIGIKRKGLFAGEIDAITRQNFKLREAILKGKDLSGMDFSNADLSGIDLSGAILKNANLKRANFSMSYRSVDNYRSANVDKKRANLSGADMTGANLTGACLKSADLTRANLTGANLEGAEYNKETEFPEGFNPQEAGMILVAS